MGHGSSRDTPDDDSVSRLSRMTEKLHLTYYRDRQRRRGKRAAGSGSGSHSKVIDAEDFAGIALLTLIGVTFIFLISPFWFLAFVVFLFL